jgi:mercuric ion transport protein
MRLLCEQDCVTKGRTLEGSNGLTLVSGILVLLMPKCAFCWAGYMSFFSSFGLVTIPYRPWFLTLSIILFILTLLKLLYKAVYKGNFLSFLLALLAGMIIMRQKLWQPVSGLNYLAVTMMGIAVAMDSSLLQMKKLIFKTGSNK